MKQALHLKLSQQLTLTPQLKQSLKLLQLPSLELELEIQQALESNPLLERIELESVDSGQSSLESATDHHDDFNSASSIPDNRNQDDQAGRIVRDQDASFDWHESFETHRTSGSQSSSANSDADFTQFTQKQESLFEHLDWQVKMTALTAKDQQIASTVLHCLDADGYLTMTPEDMVELFDPTLQIECDEIQAVLSLIKTLDPIGVGASSLQERLLILLATSSYTDTSLAEKVIEQHLDLVGARNLAKLKKVLSVSDQELSEALTQITALNPRVATQFSSDNENYLIPDVIVKKVGDQWVAQLNPENQAKLRVNQQYADLLNSPANLDEQSNAFIQENLLEAKNFIKGLMSRYDTLQLVSQAIVEQQQPFFEQGETGMQPMVLSDIAQTLEMHESTISRATSGKYLLSPRGVFELKYFFSSAVSNTDGATSSSTAIRSLIKRMVDAESKTKPLSDSKIAKELEQQGHIVARRTVAKYRESMQIAPSSQRKSLVN